jgi:hypothetical protein
MAESDSSMTAGAKMGKFEGREELLTYGGSSISLF